MSNMPWFRCYSEMRTDMKFMRIARDTGLSFLEVIGAWTVLLCIANESPDRGALLVTEKNRYCNGDVTDAFVTSPEKTEILLNAFIEMDLIRVENETYYIVSWDKRQRRSDNSNERVKRHREKNENSGGGACNGFVTLPSTSTSRSLISSLFNTYEREIGALTPTISQELEDAEKEFTAEWIIAAIQEAARNNKRNWKYVLAILNRWKIDGFQSNKKSKPNEDDPGAILRARGYTPA